MQKEWLEILFAVMVLYRKRGLAKNLVNIHVVTVCTVVDALGHLKRVFMDDLHFLIFNTYSEH